MFGIDTCNPGLKFEVQVLFEGYEEDSLQSNPDLTEMRLDTVDAKYVDIDSLGQLFERDTVSVEVTYHNDRTVQQAESVINYLVSKGVDPGTVAGFVNAAPAILPDNKKILVKARVIKM